MLGLAMSGCAAAGPGQGASQKTAGPALKPAQLSPGRKLRVVASTSILGDVVRNVGGDAVDVTVLIAPGQDPHAYEPSPRDVAAIENAQVVFTNGLGLEAGLESTIRAAASKGQPVIAASDGVKVLEDSTGEHAGGDPHVWFDPANVKVWVANIQASLKALDPARATTYEANASAYNVKLDELNTYIQQQVAKVPVDRRKLVTDHEALGYFAARNGFQIVGTVIPGYSTVAEPSAANLADLITKIRAQKVPAVFIGTTANPKVAQTVAQETGARVLPLYSESLGAPGSGADTYIGMMRTDVDTIVRGLGQ
jgi:ABC-type Zn uptake system ZnuABC Zn-binding protein ZnuA